MRLSASRDVVVVRDVARDDWKALVQDQIDAGFPLDKVQERPQSNGETVVARSDAPPWRLLALVHADKRSLDLAVVYNHAIGDGTSAKVLVRDALRALSIQLRGGDVAAALSPLPAPPCIENAVYGNERPYPSTWSEWLRILILQLVCWFAPGQFFHDTLPVDKAIRGPFKSAMVYSEPSSTERWTSLLTRIREHGARPQAYSMAVLNYILVATMALRKSQEHTVPDKLKMETGMSVSLRSAGERPLFAFSFYAHNQTLCSLLRRARW